MKARKFLIIPNFCTKGQRDISNGVFGVLIDDGDESKETERETSFLSLSLLIPPSLSIIYVWICASRKGVFFPFYIPCTPRPPLHSVLFFSPVLFPFRAYTWIRHPHGKIVPLAMRPFFRVFFLFLLCVPLPFGIPISAA